MAAPFCAGGSHAAIPRRPRCLAVGLLFHRVGTGASFGAPRRGRPLGRSARPDRQDPPRRDPGEEVSRRGGGRRAQGPHRLLRGIRRPRSRERRADGQGHHLPHLLDDQAARLGGGDGPGGRRQDRADRSGVQVPARLRQDAGERSQGRRDGQTHLRHGAGGSRDDRPGSAATHLRPRLWRDHRERARQGGVLQGGRLPGRLPVRVARRHAGRGSGAAGEGSARPQSGRGMGVQPVGGRPRPRRRGRIGRQALGVPRRALVQTAEDGRCRLFAAQGEDGAARAAVPDRSRHGQPEPRPRRERAAQERRRRRRRRRDRFRLPALRPDDAQRRAARGRANPQPHHRRPHDLGPAGEDQGDGPHAGRAASRHARVHLRARLRRPPGRRRGGDARPGGRVHVGGRGGNILLGRSKGAARRGPHDAGSGAFARLLPQALQQLVYAAISDEVAPAMSASQP